MDTNFRDYRSVPCYLLIILIQESNLRRTYNVEEITKYAMLKLLNQ